MIKLTLKDIALIQQFTCTSYDSQEHPDVDRLNDKLDKIANEIKKVKQ